MITLISGPMFAGKTTELLGRYRQAKNHGGNPILTKPRIDTRFSATEVVSHDNQREEAFVFDSLQELANHVKTLVNYTVYAYPLDVFVDEAQFFAATTENKAALLDLLLLEGSNHNMLSLFFGGLDLDAFGKPFGIMPLIEPFAKRHLKLYANCRICGAKADRTQALQNLKPLDSTSNLVEIGDGAKYEPRCSRHWLPHPEVGSI